MTKTVSAFCISAIILGALLDAGAAGAVTLNEHSFVSPTGLDGNPCTRSQPCATLQTAYAATSPGGVVDVLGAGDYGPLNITHAITIDGEGVGTIFADTSDAIDIAAGVNDGVVIRRMILNGAGNSFTGVHFTSGGALIVDNCEITFFTGNPGISFSPTNGASLWVANTQFIHDGAASSASLVITGPNNGGGIHAHVFNTSILAAIGNGIRVDGSQAVAPIDVTLSGVNVDQASGGSAIVAVAQSGGNPPTVTIFADNVNAIHNAGYGFRAVGSAASLLLSRNVIFSNSIGVGVSSGGNVVSYGDNRFADNASGDGATLGSISQK